MVSSVLLLFFSVVLAWLKGRCYQPSRWEPVFRLFRRLREIGRSSPLPRYSSDEELTHGAGLEEYEKTTDGRHKSSDFPRGEGF